MSKLPLDSSTWHLVRRLLREGLRPYLWRLGLALVAMATVAATTALSAYLLDPVVNKIFISRDKGMLLPVGAAIMLTFIAKAFATYFQATLIAQVGQGIIADMQNRLFGHLMRMDLAFFHHHSTGGLISRVIVDVNVMRAAVSNALTSIGKDFLSVVFLIALMFYQDWMLAAFSFFVFPTAILPVVRLGKRMRKVSVNTQEQMGALSTVLEQSFQGVRVVKTYGMEQYERDRVNALIRTVHDLVIKAARTRAASAPAMETLAGIAVTIVVVYGGWRVIGGETTAGAFFSFLAALLMAAQPLRSLANMNTSLQEGLAAAQRLFAVLDVAPGITDRPEAQPLAVHGGHIVFDAVRFSYDGERDALDGLCLEVPAGRTVALVGPSGAGKSTVLNLIPRFYDVTEGAIRIDGTDIRAANIASVRRHVALVSQEITLFDDTVRANIAYGRFGAADEEIVAAAQAAAAHDFISKLPQGYDTVVGEHGIKLSGGQRQRLSIARAMLKNAPILLLDEATSALDTESERLVQAALERLMRDRTTVVVAHRLSTVVNADIIYVIDHGRVVETGSHGALLAHNGLYARLHALQFAEVAS